MFRLPSGMTSGSGKPLPGHNNGMVLPQSLWEYEDELSGISPNTCDGRHCDAQQALPDRRSHSVSARHRRTDGHRQTDRQTSKCSGGRILNQLDAEPSSTIWHCNAMLVIPHQFQFNSRLSWTGAKRPHISKASSVGAR